MNNGFMDWNAFIDWAMRLDLSPNEFRVLMAVARQTIGYNKAEDWITNRRLSELTDIPGVHHAAEIALRLAVKGLIERTGGRGCKARTVYRLNVGNSPGAGTGMFP